MSNKNFQPPKDALQAAMGKRGQEEPQGGLGFGPPDFGDETEKPQFHDEEQLKARYQNFNDAMDTTEDTEQLEEEPYDPDLEESYDDDDDIDSGFTPPPEWRGVREYPTPESLRQPHNQILEDEPVVPGGPMRSEVNAWKKQFEPDNHTVNLTEHADQVFVWRTLSRTEYREIMALPNTDPLQREEIICEVCVLYPYQYNFASMANRKAGVPAVIAEQIMHESGFKRPAPPVRL